MNLLKSLLVPLFALSQAFGLASPSGSHAGPPDFLAISAFLGINTSDPWLPPTQSENDLQLTLSARTQLQFDLPVGRAPVRPCFGGYLTGEPNAWEGGGFIGITWKRTARESYGFQWGLLEKGHFDKMDAPDVEVERWHGSQFGLAGRRQSRRFEKVGYVGLASVQFKESYGSSMTNTGFNAYLGVEFGLL